MSDDSGKQASDDYDAFSVGTLFGRTFLEKLLLAIIDAHPLGQKTSETRLRIAVHVLTGENSKAETVAQDVDLPALRHMASEHHRDKGNRFLLYMKHRKDGTQPNLPKVSSDLTLAKKATDEFFDPPNEQARKSIYDRLREKFSGVYYRKQGKGHGVDFRKYFEFQAVEYDYVAETLEAQSLDLICEKLRENGVKTAR